MGSSARLDAATIVLLGSCALLPGTLRGQTGVRREITRTPSGELLDFRPNGVWRSKAREVSRLRAQLRRAALSGDPVARGVFLPSVSGILSVPAIFFAYQDAGTGSTFDITELEARLFGASPPGGLPYTIRTYYDEMSGGLFRVEGQAVGWITLAGNEEDYTGMAGTCIGNPFGTGNCNGIFSMAASIRRIAGLTEAVELADATIDFANFDNDGPDGIPNSGDDDGVVDLVAFYHSEQDGSCGGANNNHLWAHRSSLGGIETNDPAAGGGFITISDYVVQSGVGGVSGCDLASPVAIGTSAHEFGHGLGLPDLYDVAGSTEGIGHWGLMGAGNWRTQESPARMTPWSLNEMGWITIIDVTTSTSLQLPPITTSRTAYAIRVGDPNPRGEYVLVENRQGLLSDSAVVRAHCGVSGLAFPAACAGGLALWHVDSAKIATAMGNNQVNSGTIHGLALIQADGQGDLDSPANRGDAGDVWPGVTNAVVFDSLSTPAARKNEDATWMGFDLTSITQVTLNGDVTLDVVFPLPPSLIVSPTQFHVTATEGDISALPDSAMVDITGPDGGSIAWSATHGGGAWLTITANAGTGPGFVKWSRDPVGLNPGVYVDTITVTASTVSGSPALIVDTLSVLAPLVMTVTPSSRSDSAVEGSTDLQTDSASVSFEGPGGPDSEWSASHGGATWLTISAASGTGDGVVRWERNPSGLAAGVYVDTVTVTAAGVGGSPASVIDTLTIIPPLVMEVTSTSRVDSVVEGTVAPVRDSVTITFSGSGAEVASWTAVHGSGAWLTVVDAAGDGNGTVRWDRDPVGLTEGVFVDTIVVASSGAQGSPAMVVDSFIVLPPLTMTVSPDTARAVLAVGGEIVVDSGSIQFAGTGQDVAAWSISHGSNWLSLIDSTGDGSSVLRWSIDPSTVAAGVFVDRLIVAAPDALTSPDSIVVILDAQQLTLSLTPTSSSVAVDEGTSSAIIDSVNVTITGPGSQSIEWSASHGGGSWIMVETPTGQGDAAVVWQRNAVGLVPGVYVDTIRVEASGLAGSPALVVDTLVVNEVIVPLALTLNPRRNHVVARYGSAGALADSADVILTGTGSELVDWAASASAPWSVISEGGGVGSGLLRWDRVTNGLLPGVHVSTITVSGGGLSASFVDTLEIAPLEIVTPDAVRELLDGGVLTDVEREYLDAMGNRDGVYNLGDLLAHLERMSAQRPGDRRRLPLDQMNGAGRER